MNLAYRVRVGDDLDGLILVLERVVDFVSGLRNYLEA